MMNAEKVEEERVLSDSNKSVGVHIRNKLVSGVFVLIPLVVTWVVLKLLFNSLTAFARPMLRPFFTSWLGESKILGGRLDEVLLAVCALIITVGMIYVVGLAATKIAGKRMIGFGEKLLMRVPIVNKVYDSAKQVVQAFSNSGKKSFEAVVAIEYPRKGSWTIGFATGSVLNQDGENMISVFIATTPNPTSGFLILFPTDDVVYTNISVEDGLKMIMSGGMVCPKQFVRRQEVAAGESA